MQGWISSLFIINNIIIFQLGIFKESKQTLRIPMIGMITFNLPNQLTQTTDTISFRKILTNAKGSFVSLYIAGNKTIHGYLTSVMNDYFVFYSPAHKVMYISMNHLKWFIPYNKNISPYSLNNDSLPVNPTSISLARTFTEQCKKLENHIVILDNGDHPEKIGLLKKVYDNKLSLVTAESEIVYWNCQHLKTLHLP